MAWTVYDKTGTTERCTVEKLEYNGQWMGECYVTFDLQSPIPIEFEIGDYLTYRGERFEMNYDPTVLKRAARSKSGDAFKYESVKMNSLADELTRCSFLDYVSSDNEIHYTSLPTFSFYCSDISDLAERIQVNLDRVYTGDSAWTVTVQDDYESDTNISISVDNNTVWEALALVNSEFGAYFIVRNRTITIGTAGIVADNIFKYGKGNGLYQLERTAEDDQLVITRLRAWGSTQNMPSRYYNKLSTGLADNMAVQNLMLPGFPDETTDPYIDSDNISELGVREGTAMFDGTDTDLEEIYPSLEGMTASELIAAGVSCSVDSGDNGNLDEVAADATNTDGSGIDDDGEWADLDDGDAIPSFLITIKDIGFDINDYLGEDTAAISMKDGMCGGREFEITNVEASGNKYILTCNRSYDDSLGLYFPYGSYNIKAGDSFVLLNIEMPDVYIEAASQRLYEAAKEYLAKNDYVRYTYSPAVDEIYMARQNDEATASGEDSLHDILKEGDLMLFSDDDLGIDGSVVIETLVIKEGYGLIPTYEITLKEEKTVGTLEKIQNQIDSITSGSGQGSGGYSYTQISQIVKTVASSLYLSKTDDDTASGVITFLKGILFGEDGLFGIDENGNATLNDAVLSGSLTAEGDITTSGDVKSSNFSEAEQSGFGIIKSSSGKWNAFFTNLTIWGKAIFNELEIRKLSAVGGSVVLSAASSKILLVEDYYVDGEMVGWKCWYLADDGTTATQNGWQVGDQARCQSFNIEEGTYKNVGNKDYWRCVIAVSSENEKIYDDDGNELYDGQEFGWIVLSLTNAQASDYGSTYSGASWDEEYAYNSTPAADDAIVLYGHQPQDDDNSDELNRMNLIILTVADDDPQILMYQGIYTFSLEGRLVAKMAPSGWEILSSSFTWNTGSVSVPNYVDMGEWTDGCTAGQYTIWYYNGETWRFDGYTDEDGNVVTSTTETPATNASGWVQLTYNDAITSVATYYCKSESLTQPDDSEFTYTSIADVGLDLGDYLWWRIDTTYGDGGTSSTYGVSRLGEDGATGATGATGTDGVTHYYHFAYSTSSDGSENFSTTTFGGATYWGVYTDENEADSEDYADYQWTKIKGDKGDTGEAGADGADGQDGADGEDALTLTASPSSNAVNNAETETVTVYVDFYDGKTLLQIGDTEATYVYDDGESEVGYDDGSSVSETSSSFDFGVYNSAGTLCSVGDTLTTGLIYKSIETSSTHTAVLTFQVAAGTTLSGYIGYVKATYDGETRYSYITFTAVEDGADGSDGSSSLRIDLSNEVEPVLSDANGTVLESSIAGTTATLYYGATDVTSSATWSCTASGITASISSAGVVSVSDMTAEKASVVITAEYNGFTASATYSLYKTATAKYSLQLSTNAVSVGSNGTVSTSSVTATILMTTGDGTKSITSGAYSTYGVSLLYALDGATTSTGYSTSGTLTVTPSSSNSSIEFYLVQGEGKSSATISGYTILDQETVPIVKDGTGVSSYTVTYAVTEDFAQPDEFPYSSISEIGEVIEGYYIWMKITTTLTDGSYQESVSASRIGADGATGATGATGADGTTYYTHYAYATASDGSEGFSLTAFDGAAYWGVLVDTNEDDSTDYTDYEWAKFKGTSFTWNMLYDTDAPSLSAVNGPTARYISSSGTSYAEFFELEDSPISGLTYGVRFTGDSSNTHMLCWYNAYCVALTEGETYTMSCYARYTDDYSSSKVIFQYGVSSYKSASYSLTSEWVQYSWTFTAASTYMGTQTNYGSRIYIGNIESSSSCIECCGFKLEQGDTASQWAPHLDEVYGTDGTDGYALTASSSNNAVNVDDGAETVEYAVDFTIGGTIQKIGDDEAEYLYDDSSEIGYDDGSTVSETSTSYTFAVYNESGTKCVVGDSLTTGLVYKSCESSSTHTAILTFTIAKGIVLNGYKAYVKIVYGGYTGYVYLPFSTVTDGQDGADGADGTSPCQIILTNEAEVVACDGLGNVSDVGSIEGTSWVFYEGLTAIAIADYDYTVTASGCTVTTSVSAATGTITVTAMSSDTATVTVAVTYEGNTYSRVYTLTKNYSGLSYAIVVSPAVISVDADGALNTSSLTYGVRVYDNGTVTTYTDLSTSGDAYTKYGLYLYWTYKDGTSYTRLTSTSGSMSLSSYVSSIISNGGLTLYLYQGGTYSAGTLVDKEGIELVTDGATGASGSDGESALNLVATPASSAVSVADGAQTVTVYVDFSVGTEIQAIGDDETEYLYDDSSYIGYDDGSTVSTTSTSYTFAVYNASGTKCVVGDSLTTGLIYKSCATSSSHTAVLTFTVGTAAELNGYTAYVKVVYNGETRYAYFSLSTVAQGADGADADTYTFSPDSAALTGSSLIYKSSGYDYFTIVAYDTDGNTATISSKAVYDSSNSEVTNTSSSGYFGFRPKTHDVTYTDASSSSQTVTASYTSGYIIFKLKVNGNYYYHTFTWTFESSYLLSSISVNESGIALLVTSLDSLESGLKATGINITDKEITLTASNTVFLNSSGDTVAIFSDDAINANLITKYSTQFTYQDSDSGSMYFQDDDGNISTSPSKTLIMVNNSGSMTLDADSSQVGKLMYIITDSGTTSTGCSITYATTFTQSGTTATATVGAGGGIVLLMGCLLKSGSVADNDFTAGWVVLNRYSPS